VQLEDYLKELNKVQTLGQEEEQLLWAAFKQQGNEKARKRLIQSYQPLVFKTALPYNGLSCIMDIIQEGTVGLIEAVESFNPERGVAFSLFAVHRIRGRMLNYLHKESRADVACLEETSEEGISQMDLLRDTAAPVVEQVERRYLSDRVKETMQRLPAKERMVLEGLYLESGDVNELADSLQLSTSHIYRLQKNGVRRIRGMLSRFMQQWKD